MQFGIPDLLYYEEIEPGSPGLEDLGLQVMEVSGDFVAYAQHLPGQHNHLLPAKNGPKPSHNDYLALALAKQEACTLLTGDTNLRIVANKEQVNVMGTIRLLRAMIENKPLSVDDAFKALDRVQHTAAIDCEPDTDMHRVAGLAQQHSIALGRLRHQGPTLPLGMVAEGGRHAAQVVGIHRDFRQIAAEACALDGQKQAPAVKFIRPSRTGVPGLTDVVVCPVGGRSRVGPYMI
jgi:hypothetical protein